MEGVYQPYNQFLSRISVLFDILLLLPKRIWRLVLHLLWFIPYGDKLKVKSIVDWILDLPFYIIDILGIGELFQLGSMLVKPHMRKLNLLETILVDEVFLNVIAVSKVWIDDRAKLFTKNFAHAYVTTNIINSWGAIEEKIFIHELVHVCQYQKFGSVYISRALRGQWSKEGYDYGGVYGLVKAVALGKPYLDFNFEQQAQIIEDYYEVKNRMDLLINPVIVNTYNHYYLEMLAIYGNDFDSKS